MQRSTAVLAFCVVDRTFVIKIYKTHLFDEKHSTVFRKGPFSVPCCLTSTVFQLPGSSNVTALITISPDTKLYAECPGSQHKDALQRIDKCARELRQWLTKNILLLNENKTEAVTTVPLKMVVRDIGVCFDSHLDMSAQVSGACVVRVATCFALPEYVQA